MIDTSLKVTGVVLLLLALLTATSSTSVLAQNAVQATSGMSASGAVGDPRNRAKLHTELGSLYFQDGNMTVALDELRIALEADSAYAPAYNVRGLVNMYLRELVQAESDFKRALNLADGDPEINNNYGWFLCQIGREKESIAYFQRAIRNPLYQTPERALLNAGQCSQKMGESNTAEDFFERALRLSRNNPQALLQLAAINYQRSNLATAKSLLAELLRQTDPNSAVLWLALRIERRLNDRAAEANYASQLRRKFPDSTEYKELLKGNFE
jgi:type IV pilus assembly protein PilF